MVMTLAKVLSYFGDCFPAASAAWLAGSAFFDKSRHDSKPWPHPQAHVTSRGELLVDAMSAKDLVVSPNKGDPSIDPKIL